MSAGVIIAITNALSSIEITPLPELPVAEKSTINWLLMHDETLGDLETRNCFWLLLLLSCHVTEDVLT